MHGDVRGMAEEKEGESEMKDGMRLSERVRTACDDCDYRIMDAEDFDVLADGIAGLEGSKMALENEVKRLKAENERLRKKADKLHAVEIGLVNP